MEISFSINGLWNKYEQVIEVVYIYCSDKQYIQWVFEVGDRKVHPPPVQEYVDFRPKKCYCWNKIHVIIAGQWGEIS